MELIIFITLFILPQLYASEIIYPYESVKHNGLYHKLHNK